MDVPCGCGCGAGPGTGVCSDSGLVILRCSNDTRGAAWAGVVQPPAERTEHSGLAMLACPNRAIIDCCAERTSRNIQQK